MTNCELAKTVLSVGALGCAGALFVVFTGIVAGTAAAELAPLVQAWMRVLVAGLMPWLPPCTPSKTT